MCVCVCAYRPGNRNPSAHFSAYRFYETVVKGYKISRTYTRAATSFPPYHARDAYATAPKSKIPATLAYYVLFPLSTRHWTSRALSRSHQEMNSLYRYVLRIASRIIYLCHCETSVADILSRSLYQTEIRGAVRFCVINKFSRRRLSHASGVITKMYMYAHEYSG